MTGDATPEVCHFKTDCGYGPEFCTVHGKPYPCQSKSASEPPAPDADVVERVTDALAEHTLGTTWGDDGITFVGCDCGEWFGKEIEDGWKRGRAHQARAALAAGAGQGQVGREEDGPEAGHTFEIAVSVRGSSSVIGDPKRDSDWWSKPDVIRVRAWDRPAALRMAASLAMNEWRETADQGQVSVSERERLTWGDRDLTAKWLAASKAARASEHHFPADCLEEAVSVYEYLCDELNRRQPEHGGE